MERIYLTHVANYIDEQSNYLNTVCRPTTYTVDQKVWNIPLDYQLISWNGKHITRVNGNRVVEYIPFSQSFQIGRSLVALSEVITFETILVDWSIE